MSEKRTFYKITNIPKDWPIQKTLVFILETFNLLGLKFYSGGPDTDEFVNKYQDALEKGEK